VLTVAFSDLSTSPTSWAWDFGDGSTSTLQHPTHVYTTPGTYDVTLSVSNAVGTDAVTKVDYITVDVPPPITTFVAVADAHVNTSSPTKNYGTATTLRVKDEGSSSTYNSYVQFVVSGLGGAAVRTATLRLYVTDGSDDGGTLYAVDSGWTETTLTYATAPALTGAALGSAGQVTAGQWVTLDVTGVVTGEGVYSFGLTNDSSNSVYYSSRQGKGSQPPELVVETLP
jgi:PKD repeat protein